MENVSPTSELTFKDFSPLVTKKASFCREPKYEYFSVCMDQANAWLKEHTECRVQSCETLVTRQRSDSQPVIDTKVSCMLDDPWASVHNHSLRLWLVPRDEQTDGEDPDQLGVVNYVPNQLKEGTHWVDPEFQPLDQLLEHVNGTLKHTPIRGRILNVETVDIRYSLQHRCAYDSDRTVWKEKSGGDDDRGDIYIYMFRLFFIQGVPASEQLGYQDIIAATETDTQETLMGQARDWIQQHPDFRITNVQSIKYRYGEEDNILNTLATVYTWGNEEPKLTRILRIYYAHSGTYTDPHNSPTPVLHFRNFVPGAYTRIICASVTGYIPRCENQDELLARLQTWLRVTGAKVVNMETFMVEHRHAFATEDIEQKAEMCIHMGASAAAHPVYSLNVMRVYIDGAVSEPPEGTLPELPVTRKYCTIL